MKVIVNNIAPSKYTLSYSSVLIRGKAQSQKNSLFKETIIGKLFEIMRWSQVSKIKENIQLAVVKIGNHQNIGFVP